MADAKEPLKPIKMWCNHEKKRIERGRNMKREFVKNLLQGKLTNSEDEKAIIDSIMDENSTDIGRAKGNVEDLKTQLEDLQNQIKDRDTQLDELKKVDAEGLQKKIEELQEDNKRISEESATKLHEINRMTAIKDALREANAKDVEKVIKLLDLTDVDFDKKGNLTGLTEQLESLTKDELTKSWFKETTPPQPTGTEPTSGGGKPTPTKKPSEMSYAELDEFMKSNPDVDISTLE